MNDDLVKESIRNYILTRAPEDWEAPKLKSLSLRLWTGMLYDGLAYGNWPWVNFNLKEDK